MKGDVRVDVVDHYDSYTWNLVHLVAQVVGSMPRVVQHDQVSAADLSEFTHVVLSPGPGTPDDAADFAVGAEVLRAARVPVLGVCLGMQGLVSTYGGSVRQVEPAHGLVGPVAHDGAGLFGGVPSPFRAVRYHSLAALEVPACLRVTAWSDDADRAVMGVAHRELPQVGVQFHPESVLTEHGSTMVANFLTGGAAA